MWLGRHYYTTQHAVEERRKARCLDESDTKLIVPKGEEKIPYCFDDSENVANGSGEFKACCDKGSDCVSGFCLFDWQLIEGGVESDDA